MRLKYITCSGLNEKTEDALTVYAMAAYHCSREKNYPDVEIGIQVSGQKCAFGSPRYRWLKELHYFALKYKKPARFALHLNSDWVEKFCAGEKVAELEDLLSLKNCQGKPFLSRIQLNFKIGRNQVPSVEKLAEVLKEYTIPGRKFIVSYNEANAAYLKELYKLFKKVDVIYDNSFGEGVLGKWKKPCFGSKTKVVQGYAGGLSPENICKEFEKIKAVLPKDAVFSIDAEKGLKDSADGEKSYYRICRYLGLVYYAAFDLRFPPKKRKQRKN